MNIGDIVKVHNPGQTYSTYTKAAEILGADYSFYHSSPTADYVSRKSKSSDKWQYGDVPTENDVAVIKNIMDIGYRTNIVLIERISDSKQFIIGIGGLDLNTKDFLEQELFEI